MFVSALQPDTFIIISIIGVCRWVFFDRSFNGQIGQGGAKI